MIIIVGPLIGTAVIIFIHAQTFLESVRLINVIIVVFQNIK